MKFFKRKPKIVDLTETYKKEQEKLNNIKQEAQESPSTENTFGFLGNMANASSDSKPAEDSSTSYVNIGGEVEEKRKRLAKRISSMTEKLEEVSNSLYHLQQRIEVLEKKLRVNDY